MNTREFGIRIEQTLTARGWTQGQLSAYSGVGQSHISQIIRGMKTPRIDVVVSLARALDVSVDWLVGIESADSVMLAPDEDELLKAYRELDEPHRKVVLIMAKGLPR